MLIGDEEWHEDEDSIEEGDEDSIEEGDDDSIEEGDISIEEGSDGGRGYIPYNTM